jgi:hypothetical protein
MSLVGGSDQVVHNKSKGGYEATDKRIASLQHR